MDHKQLDALIKEFEYMIPNANGMFSFAPPHDWRPMFAKAKEIQGAFGGGVRYPTKQERDAAWVKFNDLRNLVFERANTERSTLRFESEQRRNEILGHIKYAGYDPGVDILFFFLPTTVEDMKQKGVTLKEGGQMLSRYKDKMLKEHKDECFEKIQELRRTHDMFWGEYKRLSAQRRLEMAEKQQSFKERTEANLRANQERLEKATIAYERVEANLDSNREKLASARNPDFAERVEGWIAQDEDKLRSIEESMERARQWIKEDEERLSDLERRKYR